MPKIFEAPFFIAIYLFTAIAAGDVWRIFNYTGEIYLLILLSIVIIVIAAQLAVRAMQNERPGFIAVFLNLSIIYAILLDYFVFHIYISPEQYVCTGIIIASCVVVALQNRSKKSSSTPEDQIAE